jgi:hypothetical protein
LNLLAKPRTTIEIGTDTYEVVEIKTGAESSRSSSLRRQANAARERRHSATNTFKLGIVRLTEHRRVHLVRFWRPGFRDESYLHGSVR